MSCDRCRPRFDLPYKEARQLLTDAFERDYIANVVTETRLGDLGRERDNLSAAARRAGLDRAYIRRLLYKHGFRER